MPEEVLFTDAGFQLPGIPFVEVPGNTGAADPLQIAGIAVKTGTVG